MKNLLILSVVLLFGAALILGGCSQESSTSGVTEGDLNFTDDFGGYQATDEPPAFGDEEISVNYPEPEDIESDLNNIALLDSIEAEPDVLVYSLEILWGMLEYDSTNTTFTDWSGSLSVETGCVKVIRKILFERFQDYFVRPRVNPQKLEWVSLTSTHYDGVLVFLYFRADVVDPAATTVTFETGPYSRTFTLAELDSLSEIVEVDNLGNQVSIEAMKLERLECPEGFLEGRWIKTPGARNIFYGRFISRDGLFLGHLKGHWGTSSSGEQLFFGKWINHYGRFKGFLKGLWGFDMTAEVAESRGWFDGEFFDSHANILGTLSGKWVSKHRGSMPDSGATDKVPKHARGFFHGLWKRYCN